MTTNPPTTDFRKGTPVRSLVSWSALAAVIECTRALFFVSFLNHGRLKGDNVEVEDRELDAGGTGAAMMVVESRDALSAGLRERCEGDI
jgi:hypothetical protein